MKNPGYISFLKRATVIICTPSGQDRSFTVRETPEKNSIISYRKTCSRFMIPQGDRDMRFGTGKWV
jgi:hypothetical protein